MKQAVSETKPYEVVESNTLCSWTLIPSQELQGLHLLEKNQLCQNKGEKNDKYEGTQLPPLANHSHILRKPVPNRGLLVHSTSVPANISSYAPVASSDVVYT
jgi:hypothetical protein